MKGHLILVAALIQVSLGQSLGGQATANSGATGSVQLPGSNTGINLGASSKSDAESQAQAGGEFGSPLTQFAQTQGSAQSGVSGGVSGQSGAQSQGSAQSQAQATGQFGGSASPSQFWPGQNQVAAGAQSGSGSYGQNPWIQQQHRNQGGPNVGISGVSSGQATAQTQGQFGSNMQSQTPQFTQTQGSAQTGIGGGSFGQASTQSQGQFGGEMQTQPSAAGQFGNSGQSYNYWPGQSQTIAGSMTSVGPYNQPSWSQQRAEGAFGQGQFGVGPSPSSLWTTQNQGVAGAQANAASFGQSPWRQQQFGGQNGGSTGIGGGTFGQAGAQNQGQFGGRPSSYLRPPLRPWQNQATADAQAGSGSYGQSPWRQQQFGGHSGSAFGQGGAQSQGQFGRPSFSGAQSSTGVQGGYGGSFGSFTNIPSSFQQNLGGVQLRQTESEQSQSNSQIQAQLLGDSSYSGFPGFGTGQANVGAQSQGSASAGQETENSSTVASEAKSEAGAQVEVRA